MDVKTLPPDGSGKDLNKISGSTPSGNIDKIRDILFGNQMRDYDRRFSRLEERIQREQTELKEEIRKRFDSLETYIRNEIDALSDRLKSEQNERGDSLKEINREFKEITQSLEKKASQLDDQMNRNHRDLRQNALDQSKQLMEEIHSKHNSISQSLERAVQELTVDKMERSGLADLFTEMALRLNNQFQIENVEGTQDE
jgi:DNA repair exonuclease SbcCD ATPase subunit